MVDEYIGARGRRFVSIYRSARKDGMYLFVDRKDGLAKVPETLRELFGSPVHVMDLLLTPDRALAQADARDVLARIEAQGFHLQLPPAPDEESRAIINANDKLVAGRF